MACRLARPLAIVAAVMLAAGSARSADAPTPVTPKSPEREPAKRGFLSLYLAPRIDSELAPDRHAALESADRAANPWLLDATAPQRIQREALRATEHALKQWALDRLNVQGLGFALAGHGAPQSPLGEHTTVRFGFSQMAPRAEMLVPMTRGRFRFGADARGRLGTGFDTASGALRFGATLDPLRHGGTIALTTSF